MPNWLPGARGRDNAAQRASNAYGDSDHRRVSVSKFRDHWADTEAEWSRGGAWRTSLPPTVVANAIASAIGHMDMPFLMPVPAVEVYITVQGVSRVPDPIQARLPPLLDAVERSSPTSTPSMQPSPNQLSDMAACSDALPKQRFEVIRDATRRGLDRLVSVPEAGATGRTWRFVRTGQGPIDSVRRSWFPSVAGLSWPVGTVAFVELRRSPRRYLWDVLAEVLIGRARPLRARLARRHHPDHPYPKSHRCRAR